MNTTKIYYAQLNVCSFFTIETISELIDRLKQFGQDVYYNNETRSIDIENPSEDTELGLIRDELKHWLVSLPANINDITTLCDNINFVFNITKIMIDNSTIIKVYLY